MITHSSIAWVCCDFLVILPLQVWVPSYYSITPKWFSLCILSCQPLKSQELEREVSSKSTGKKHSVKWRCPMLVTVTLEPLGQKHRKQTLTAISWLCGEMGQVKRNKVYKGLCVTKMLKVLFLLLVLSVYVLLFFSVSCSSLQLLWKLMFTFAKVLLELHLWTHKADEIPDSNDPLKYWRQRA